jgi:broad specificity phosphatase PhoE
MLIHVTRHGQVLPAGADSWSQPDYPPGDPPLSEMGMHQAHLLGERLAQTGFRGQILSSPYRRTLQTACQIAAACDLTVQPAAPMREIVKKVEQMTNFVGMTTVQIGQLHPYISVPADFADQWWSGHAESDTQVEARVAPFVDDLLETVDGDVLLVGHGASTGGVIDHLLRKFAPEQITEPTPGWNCALSTFRCTEHIELLQRMDTEHLPEDHVTSNAQPRITPR